MIELIIQNNVALSYFFLILLSLIIGSFLNLTIYRLPLMLMSEWRQECHLLLNIPEAKQDRAINLFFPRSFCPNCQTTVSAWCNIPLISYLFLRGRCSSCKNPIPKRYPLVEILSAVLSVIAAMIFGFTIHLLFALVFVWINIVIIFIDWEHQILPDSLSLGLLWLGLLANTQSLFTNINFAVFSAVAAYLFLWLILKIYYLITAKIGMGNGDFKLFAAFGAWFGGLFLPLILLLSSLTGLFFGLIYLRKGKHSKDTPIPFGPFLCASGLVSLFWGKSIIAWYLGYFFH